MRFKLHKDGSYRPVEPKSQGIDWSSWTAVDIFLVGLTVGFIIAGILVSYMGAQ